MTAKRSAPTIDWYYHRPGCITCKRSQGFLEEAGAQITEQVNASKVKLGPAEALKLARAAADVYVAKGKKLVHWNMKKDAPSDDELLSGLIGPSGNLRAPTMRRGKALLVGFHPEEFPALLS